MIVSGSSFFTSQKIFQGAGQYSFTSRKSKATTIERASSQRIGDQAKRLKPNPDLHDKLRVGSILSELHCVVSTQSVLKLVDRQ